MFRHCGTRLQVPTMTFRFSIRCLQRLHQTMRVRCVQSKYEIVPGKVYKLGDCDKHVNDMQQRLMLLGYLPSDEPSDVF